MLHTQICIHNLTHINVHKYKYKYKYPQYVYPHFKWCVPSLTYTCIVLKQIMEYKHAGLRIEEWEKAKRKKPNTVKFLGVWFN